MNARELQYFLADFVDVPGTAGEKHHSWLSALRPPSLNIWFKQL